MLLGRIDQSTLFQRRVYSRSNITQCIICLDPANQNLCTDCHKALPRLIQACPSCAEPSHHGHICGACLSKPPAFDQVISPFLLLPPITSMILKWKEQTKHLGIELLINELNEHLKSYQFDGVTYVPYHWRRLFKRGRHPVRLLADAIASERNLPLINALKRVQHQHTQKGLNRKQRQQNLKGVFQCRPNAIPAINGQNLLLVDDVLTTGATCHQIARLLKSAGANSVSVACLARTPLSQI